MKDTQTLCSSFQIPGPWLCFEHLSTCQWLSAAKTANTNLKILRHGNTQKSDTVHICLSIYLCIYLSISLSLSLSLCIPFLINMQVLTAILVLQPARLGPILLISASLRMLAINSWTWLSRAHIWVSHGVTMLKINSINQDLPRIWYS